MVLPAFFKLIVMQTLSEILISKNKKKYEEKKNYTYFYWPLFKVGGVGN